MKLHKDNTTCYGRPPRAGGALRLTGGAGPPQLQVLSKGRRSQLEGA